MHRFTSNRMLLGCVTVAATSYLYYNLKSKNEKQEFRMMDYFKQGIRHLPHDQYWIPPSRDEMIKDLKTQEYDLLIIGGGATGAGCVLDAASRGLKVACVERDDFSAGTSSKSTKLVHGGVRYLEKAFWNLDKGQYDLVVEALHERTTFLNIAPYLSYEVPIMLPVYKWYMAPYYYVGAKFYDLFAGRSGLTKSYFMGKKKALETFPMLNGENLFGAIIYYDGKRKSVVELGMQNDSRMNMALTLTAIQQGATVANHVEVVSLLKENGKLCGATLRDKISNETWNVKAKGIINATGPFTDSIRQMDEQDCKQVVAPSSGVHVTLPSYFCPKGMGLVDANTSDGRVVFFLPWQGAVIAGTTGNNLHAYKIDEPTQVTENPIPTEKEIDFILNEISHYFGSDLKLRKSDVLSAWSGIRPLVKDPNAVNTESLVRNHMVHVSNSGLLTIAGGKWTTYRNMASDAINKAISEFGLSNKAGECRTENLKVVGSYGYTKSMYLKLIQEFGLEKDVAKHLVHSYGDRAKLVAAEKSSKKRLVEGFPYLESEVNYAVKHEYAQTIVDVIARRTRLSFLDCAAADKAIPKIAEIMSEELNWNKERKEEEIQNAKVFLKSMGLDYVLMNKNNL
ncbi:DAO-domain-containing protein [Rozella allomycis CSF55]|uniref:glycerol-3-phosphate dehydrogenase n=1 Tax=Rozella allomycis (strain CSF55) TaxID=988480 RepID=A0A075AZ28_ROZAC|nr:FAD-dependent glycerol-3-phosphate dehydrogenase domain-containing protein [Rozella allomycis CSF55]RKP20831.1 DAO-domain-containing protein [Rozella allomycis CSF55]|eukprot:EPZ33967.1 FAD-dependent glycerol-3-phosphate dehydrogenase domain-containing protein [Rozella allomycis CSF55]